MVELGDTAGSERHISSYFVSLSLLSLSEAFNCAGWHPPGDAADKTLHAATRLWWGSLSLSFPMLISLPCPHVAH